ncbi:MAG TPA: histidine kinase [Usitatibacter sp.]|nr:histidine kinase [Usitatibacter sp.]
MKPVSNFLHNTPWWLLLTGGFALLIGLAMFTVPLNVMHLEKRGATPEEKRAISAEIESAYSDSALNIGRSVLKEMLAHTKDPARREELEDALREVEAARDSVREAGQEVARAKQQAAKDVAEAIKDAQRSIADARRETKRALKDAGVENAKALKSLSKSLAAAEDAERAVQEAPVPPPAPEAPDAPKGPKLPDLKLNGPGGAPIVTVQVDTDAHPAVPPLPAVQLPPELREEIHKSVTGGLYRMGVGAGLILIFIPLLAITIVAKFYIDRSRASLEVAESKKREAEFHRMSQQVTEAKLSALQAQVEPHFLYNTLASVQALTEVDPQQANLMTGHLIQYLRNALPKMRESVSTVGQEMELVRAYLNILQMRMGKRLSFEIDVPQELMDAPFPPLMLPSLVENAIKHGLEPLREGGTVRIAVSAEGDTLRLRVSDTGRGFGDSLGTGVGLTNIRERLAALYGDKGKLTLEASEPHGVVATIEVPRDGARSVSAQAAGFGGDVPVMPEAPKTAAMRTLAAMGTAERAWRKGLSFTFIVLVVIAAVFAGLGIVGVATGVLPVQIGDEVVSGPTGALIGTAGIAAAFAIVVVAIAAVLAVLYGLGFLFVGLAIFIPIVILVAMTPAIAPFILLVLAIVWLVRRSNKSKDTPPPPSP